MFWIGFAFGFLLGVIAGVVILLFMIGASERMTYEEWESMRPPPTSPGAPPPIRRK